MVLHFLIPCNLIRITPEVAVCFTVIIALQVKEGAWFPMHLLGFYFVMFVFWIVATYFYPKQYKNIASLLEYLRNSENLDFRDICLVLLPKGVYIILRAGRMWW